IAALVLGGCASGPKFAEGAPSFKAPPEEEGRIYVYPAPALGAAIRPDVRGNGDVGGSANPHGFFYVDRPAGSPESLTSTQIHRKLTLVLEKGQTRYVRLGISMGFFVGHVYPELVESDVGEKEIAECSYTGAGQAKKP